MKKLLPLIAVLFIGFLANAQQDANFTHYMFNNVYNNPGSAGMKGATNFQLLYRYQYLGHTSYADDPSGSPKTAVFSADHPLLKLKGGVSLNMMNDQFGIQKFTSFQLAFSKHVDLGKGKLGIGLNGSMNLYGINGTLRPPGGEESVAQDPVLSNSFNNKPYFDMSGGLWYQTKDYFGGIAVNRLLDVAYEFDTTSSASAGGSKRHMNITGGYNLEVTYDFILTPSVMFKMADFKRASFEISAVGTYQEKFWGGLNFRQGDAVGILLGAAFLEGNALRVGYGIDIVAKGVEAKSATSHEVMLAYFLPPAVIKYKPIIRTPRYRF